MAGRQDWIDNSANWSRVFGWFAVALAVETLLFIFAGFDVATWQVGFIALQAALMGILAIVARSWDMHIMAREINELRMMVNELGSAFGSAVEKVGVTLAEDLKEYETSENDEYDYNEYEGEKQTEEKDELSEALDKIAGFMVKDK